MVFESWICRSIGAWTTKHTEGDEFRTLEYSTDGQDLRLCLAKLMENGLEDRCTQADACACVLQYPGDRCPFT